MIMAAIACNRINPFLTEWNTPYGIPDFGQIKERDYLPAVKIGIRQQQGEIDAIISNSETPSFENVVEAYERSGAILGRVTDVLFNVSESDATESLQRIVEKILPMLSSHSDNIFMNPYFFAKVETLYNKKDELGLDREQQMAHV